MHIRTIRVVLLLAGACAFAAEMPRHTLLPTAALAREIGALRGPSQDLPRELRSLHARVAALRRAVGNFVVRQIEAYPSISGCDLQKQLTAAFSSQTDSCGVAQNGYGGGIRLVHQPLD